MRVPAKYARVAFAMTMALITSSVVSFIIIAINVGFGPNFPVVFLKSFAIAYAVVVPFILIVGPRVQALVDRITEKPEAADER